METERPEGKNKCKVDGELILFREEIKKIQIPSHLIDFICISFTRSCCLLSW